jgi:hypothetical protein
MSAMLIDLGCRTNADPVACYESPTKEHSFVQAAELNGKFGIKVEDE